MRFEGRRIRLPVGIDVSTYRIIQEGLTNALKHAGPVATAVTLRYQPRAVTVEIRNAAGTGHALPTAAGGHGLMGIRERVAMYGGDLQAGPSSVGGYTLQARLPLEQDGT